MADHRVCFTLGSHMQFGSLDFVCMGVDHDLVLLPPSVPVDRVSFPGSDERVGDLDPTDVEGECVPPSPTESLSSPANIDSISKSMADLCLHTNEAHAPRGAQLCGFDHPRLGRQLDATLGPRPSQDELHGLYSIFTNALLHLLGEPPPSREISVVPTQLAWLTGCTLLQGLTAISHGPHRIPPWVCHTTWSLS
jgi:hypothetical protein